MAASIDYSCGAAAPVNAVCTNNKRINLDCFSVATYNLGGLQGQGSLMLNELCSSTFLTKIVFLQETWLTPSNMVLIENFDPAYRAYGISAMGEAVATRVLRG